MEKKILKTKKNLRQKNTQSTIILNSNLNDEKKNSSQTQFY